MGKEALVASIDALDKWVILFGILVAIGVVGEAFAGYFHWRWGSQLHDVEAGENRTLRTQLADAVRDTAQANEALAIVNERILTERRLTANERWRLERVERAVLPRSQYVDWAALISELRAGGFKPVNIVLVGKSMEASGFALGLLQAFQTASAFGKYIDLSRDASAAPSPMHSSTGAMVAVGNPEGERIAEMLWRKFSIGGGSGPASLLPKSWSLPSGENFLIVDDNGWSNAPGAGQPGEGLDKYGGPDPAPH